MRLVLLFFQLFFFLAHLSSQEDVLKYRSAYGDATSFNITGAELIADQPKENEFFWTGREDSLWYNKNNWLQSTVPNATDNALISTKSIYLPYIDTLVQVNELEIKGGAEIKIAPIGSLTCSKLDAAGDIFLYGNVQSRGSLICKDQTGHYNIQYIYESSQSVEKQLALPVSKMSYPSLNIPNIWEFKNQQWLYFSDSLEILVYLNVYKFKLDTASAIQFFGEANTNDFELQFNKSGFQPIPNPYTASLSWDAFDLDNLSNKALYRFNESDSSFSSYIDELGITSPLIQPLDVVWVYAEPGESVYFNYDKIIHASNFKPNNDPYKNKLALKVKGNGGEDEMHISFNQQATPFFDKEYDALKSFISAQNGPSIFCWADTLKLSVNQLPDTTMLDFAVYAGVEGDFNISISENVNFDFVYLEDLILGTKTNLMDEDYNFQYFLSDGNYPFKLYFKPWVIEPLEETDIEMYFYLDRLVVSSRKQIDYANIKFYDMSGKVAFEFDEQNFFQFEKLVNISGGHYIVQLRSGDVVSNLKVFVL